MTYPIYSHILEYDVLRSLFVFFHIHYYCPDESTYLSKLFETMSTSSVQGVAQGTSHDCQQPSGETYYNRHPYLAKTPRQ